MNEGAGGPLVLGLYGAGGFGREVLPIARKILQREHATGRWERVDLCFVESAPQSVEVNGCRVVSEQEFLGWEHATKWFNVTVGDGRLREQLSLRCLGGGALPVALRAASHLEMDGNNIGEGALFCANTIVTSNAVIGRFFQANLNSYVAHDCVIGDFVTFAPNVMCNGNVRIGSYAYIGAGAILCQGRVGSPLVVGEGAIVGMGAVVTKDVPPGVTVVGNPARQLKRI